MEDKNSLLFALLLPILLVVAFAIYLATAVDIKKQEEFLGEPVSIEEELAKQSTQTLESTQSSESSKMPKMIIKGDKKYTANLITTEGTVKIELNSEQTPITTNNFVFLAGENFYDNTIFHRVIKNFMIQGGDPKGDGTGGPGYKFVDEPFDGSYERGVVAMANSGPNTNGSQFFIMHKTYPLPKNYTIFGKVVDGMDVVDKIAEADTTTSAGGEKAKPINPVVVLDVEIEEN